MKQIMTPWWSKNGKILVPASNKGMLGMLRPVMHLTLSIIFSVFHYTELSLSLEIKYLL